MSITILYNSVFLRSARGITPVILSGDSNVYDVDGHGRATRRERHWCCFDNKLAVSEDELMKRVEGLRESEEIWRRWNRIVDGEGLIRWMRKGIRNATSVEDVIAANGFPSLFCCISVWGREHYGGKKLFRDVSTTEEFDEWVDEAKEYVNSLDANHDAFYLVKFPCEIVRTTPMESGSWVVELRYENGRVCYMQRLRNGMMQTTGQKEKAMHYSTKQNAERAYRKVSDALAARGVVTHIYPLLNI